MDLLTIRFIVSQTSTLQQAWQSGRTLLDALSWRISCGNCSGNRPPLANAGLARTVYVGETIVLDGSASADADGDALSFSWSVLAAPEGAVTQLTEPTSVRPSIVLPAEGTYLLQLIVSDAHATSTATVALTTMNSRPVARAGTDRTVAVGARVVLDGSASSDVDGDALTYEWQLLETPESSVAALLNADAITPLADFIVDRPGRYVAQLTVRDAESSSAPDSTIISTLESAPVANAGADRTVSLGEPVELSADASSDPDLDPLSYRWSLSVPPGSSAQMSDKSGPRSAFAPDVPGTYAVQLIVSDGTQDSQPDTVAISTENSRPVAIARADSVIELNGWVALDGSESTDPDDNELSFNWSVLSAPPGSDRALWRSHGNAPDFKPDVTGLYVIQLIVSDGVLESEPSTVQVSMLPPLLVVENSPSQEVHSSLITIRGYVSEPATLRIGGTEVPVGSDNRFEYTLQLLEGWNSVSVQAQTPQGRAGVWSGVFILDSPPPPPDIRRISVEPRPNGLLLVRGLAGWIEEDVQVSVTNLRTGQTVTVSADYDGAYEAELDGLESDDLSIVAIDEAQNRSPVVLLLGIGNDNLEIAVSEPLNGAIVADGSIVVKGQLFGPADAGVSVNDRSVVVFEGQGGRWFSSLVNVRAGINTIVIAAKRPDGSAVSTQVEITRTGATAFMVAASPESGPAPLDVMFQITQLEPGEVTRVEVDLENDGTVDIVSEGDDRYIAARYEESGRFDALVTITPSTGNPVSVRVPITVLTGNQIDRQIKRTWQAIVAAVQAGDAAAALSYFTQTAAERYGPAFQQLGANLPTIAGAFGPIEMVKTSGPLVEYALVRIIDGTEQAFLVSFMRGRDGVWRLSGL